MATGRAFQGITRRPQLGGWAGLCCFAALLVFAGGCRHRAPGVSAPAPVSAQKPLTFVYVHGFGGAKADPVFCANLEAFLRKAGYDGVVLNHQWDSVAIEVLKAGAKWLEAQQRADAEAGKLRESVLMTLEKQRRPYVLVGFSVGSRVVLRALQEARGQLTMLRGVYFLGSAMTRDTTLDRSCLPPGMKIINYHSEIRDRVHQIAFNFMAGKPAGGRVGFDDEEIFDNYPVSCSHVHKGSGTHIDYSQLADSIGYIALLREHVLVPGKVDYNLESAVTEGDVWWNKILRLDHEIDGVPCTLEIEQLNLNRDYFRAIAVFADGKRRRVARGGNLHAILNELRALPPHYWRLRR